MSYFLGKKTGLSPSLLGQLGLSIDRTSKTPSLLGQIAGTAPAATSAATPTSSTASTTMASDPCISACDDEYNACMNEAATLEQKQACVANRNSCKSNCGGGDGGGGGGTIDPDCSSICTANYNACMDAAASLEEKQACKTQKDACMTQCGEVPNESCNREICLDSGLLARPACPTKQNQTFSPCSSAPQQYCNIHNPGPHECPEGTTWDEATQTCKAPTPGKCGLGANGTHPGCACGKWYDLPPGETACGTPGYVPVQKQDGVRCECSDWCVSIGYDADCVTENGGGGGDAEQYEYPQGIQDLLDRLLGRANYFLGLKPGYSQTSLDKQFGVGYDKIRRQGDLSGEALKQTLQEQGLVGTGTEVGATQANAWNTERNVADLEREIFTMNEAQKRNDIVTFTEQANKLFQAGLTFEQIREAINSARRSEGQAAMALLLQYLLGMGQMYNSAG